MELKKASLEFERQIFLTHNKGEGTVGLESYQNKIEGLYTEIGGYSHKEQMQVSLEPSENISDIHVYDSFMTEIPSDANVNGNNVIVSFWLDFSPNEKKQANIFYKGGSTTNIDYIPNPSEMNVTGRILSEYEIPVISKEKCSDVQGMNYDTLRSKIGFNHNFKVELTDCTFGIDPPSANVFVNNFPVLIEKQNSLISLDMARVMVW